MTTSGDEHTKHNSDIVNNSVPQTSEDAASDSPIPSSNSILKIIYEELTPESAERILRIVQREQDYEKQAARARFWLALIRFLLLALVAIAVITFGIVVSLHQKSVWSWTWKGYVFWAPFVTGVATAITAIAASAAWQSLRARKNNASDHLHGHISDD
jgi:uncharacterized membrane protein